ncbi:hypothetical protein TTRE_0000623101 [Trichuris trichiura]|uniref:Uncharacterized protein n=1 Tax=Trichuris trichiura TaxID=36087 RepID=A0A077ZC11_TRITR|nr:hypothetical protein TTRE_0000623101 [Trichuris trichiura]
MNQHCLETNRFYWRRSGLKRRTVRRRIIVFERIEYRYKSIVTDLPTKKRSRLQVVRRGDLCLRVTSIESNIDRLAQSHLGEPSSSR